jgi:hypothetical protein
MSENGKGNGKLYLYTITEILRYEEAWKYALILNMNTRLM